MAESKSQDFVEHKLKSLKLSSNIDSIDVDCFNQSTEFDEKYDDVPDEKTQTSDKHFVTNVFQHNEDECSADTFSGQLDNLYNLSKTLNLYEFENEMIKYPEGDIFTQTCKDLKHRFNKKSNKNSPEKNNVSEFLTNQIDVSIPYKKNHTKDNLQIKKTPIKYKATVSAKPKVKQLASKTTYQTIAFVVIITSIIAVCLVAIYGYNIYLSDEKIRNFEKKICPFNKLVQKYPLEEESLWLTLKYEIEDIINSNNLKEPKIYLFLRNKNSITDQIMEDIADVSASCLEKNLKPITLTAEDFDSNDYSHVIAKIRNNIADDTTTIILTSLNDVSPEAVKALDTIVLEENSVTTKKFIFFLSLVTNSGFQGQPVQTAEQILRDLFEPSFNENKLELIITQISKKVFRLQS